MSYAINHHAEVLEPVPDFQSIDSTHDSTQISQYCRQNTVVELTSPEGVVESGGQRPKSDADLGMTYQGGMKCQWGLQPEVTIPAVQKDLNHEGLLATQELTAAAVQKDLKLEGLLATQTVVVLNIEYASLESSYESVISGASLLMFAVL